MCICHNVSLVWGHDEMHDSVDSVIDYKKAKQIILLRVAANLKMAEWNVSGNVTTLNKKLRVQQVYLAEYTNTWPTLTASKNRCVHFLYYCVMRLSDVRM